jgi:DNA topoisomerase VI subunit B
MEKHEVCMDILTPEDETTTLSQKNGHQSLNDLPSHPRPQLHHCKSIKAHTVTHLLQQSESEKVLKNVVLEGIGDVHIITRLVKFMAT